VRIDMHPNWPTIDCRVRNISAEGALIEMSGEFNTSIKFDLIYLANFTKRTCRQVWRDGSRLGVAFA
jgi:hypothetical protein